MRLTTQSCGLDFRTHNITRVTGNTSHISKAISFTEAEHLVLPIWTECYRLDVGLSANFAWPGELGGKLPIFLHPSGRVAFGQAMLCAMRLSSMVLFHLQVRPWRITNLFGGTTATSPASDCALQTLRLFLVLPCFLNMGKIKFLATLSLGTVVAQDPKTKPEWISFPAWGHVM